MKLSQFTSPYSSRPAFDARQIGLVWLFVGAIFLFVVIYVGLAFLGVKDQTAFNSAFTFSISMIFFGQVTAAVTRIRDSAQKDAEGDAEGEYSLNELELLHRRVSTMLNNLLRMRAEMKIIQPRLIENRSRWLILARNAKQRREYEEAQKFQKLATQAEKLIREGKDLSQSLDESTLEAVEINRMIEQKAAVAEAVVLLQQKVDLVAEAEARFSVLHQEIIKELEYST